MESAKIQRTYNKTKRKPWALIERITLADKWTSERSHQGASLPCPKG